jgi:hypothetical protein
MVPLLKVLFAHIAACCRALALSVHLRKGGRQAGSSLMPTHCNMEGASHHKVPVLMANVVPPSASPAGATH